MKMKEIGVLLADDHTILRDCLKLALGLQPGINVVGEAANGEETVELALHLNPDVILMDVAMPGMDGIEACRIIRRHNEKIKLLLHTMREDEETLHRALSRNIDGYILKSAGLDFLLEAIRSVVGGKKMFSREVAGLVRARRSYGTNGNVHAMPAAELLSEREREVVRALAQGLTSSSIAGALGISTSTVNNHRRNIMNKLQCQNTAALISLAARMGIIAPRRKEEGS